MKRFLLFAGYDDCPSGGMEDFKGDFDYFNEAIEQGKSILKEEYYVDWAHIYDQEEKEISWKLNS